MRDFKNKTVIAGLVTFIVFVGLAGHALAQKPNVVDGGNLWRITAYDDTSPIHKRWATQGICFLPYSPSGMHIQGIWYSTTFPDWNGRYSQEGDRLLMHGDYAKDVGHDGMVIELFTGTQTPDTGAGQWTEWREDGAFGRTIGFCNCRLVRVGFCKHLEGVKRMSPEQLMKMVKELSSKVKPRLRKDGKVSKIPMDPKAAPLPKVVQFKR